MFNQYLEHLQHSQIDGSQFDGFDKGDGAEWRDGGNTVIGRLRSISGAKVEIVMHWQEIDTMRDEFFSVWVDGIIKYDNISERSEAIAKGRQALNN